jgi:NADPH2:quinone reductase
VIRFYKTGGPEVLRIEDVRCPKPTGNEALIRAQTVALSRPDLLWREESHSEAPVFPAQVGYDGAGVVKSVGPEVKSFKVRDHVSKFPAVSLLNSTPHAETIFCPETALLVYPEDLTPEQAAAADTGLLTADFAPLELACLKRYPHVVVTAASSFMGPPAFPMIRFIGAKTSP